jgi:diacylglycerol kinase family enzyme
MGSGNDLALALDVPTDVDAALDILVNGRDSRIDLGRFNDGWFVNSLGLGFEAQVTIESLKIHRLRGFAIYLWAVVKALRKLRCPQLVIRADGRVIEGRRLLMCVGSGPRVGGGFRLTPDARPADGIFDLCVADAMSRLNVLRIVPKSLDGTHVGHPLISMLQARKIEIELRPKALRVLVSESKAKELDADG